MQKRLVGAIVLSCLIPALANAREPDAACYMQTSSGRLINLDGVCGNTINAPIAPSTSRGTAASPASTKSPSVNPAAYPPDRYISMGEREGMRFLLDKQSIRQSRKGLSFEIVGVSDSATGKFQFSIDCTTRRFTADKIAFYDSKGQLVSRQSSQWLLSTPGSEAERVMINACQRLSQS